MSHTSFNGAIERITRGDFPLEVLIQTAQQLTAAGELDQSRQLYKIWISFNRDHPLLFIAHFNCSTLMGDLRDDEAASAELEAALALKPDFAPACINLGSALERRGQVQAAVERWKNGLEHMSAFTGEAIGYKTTLLKQISRVLSDNQQLAAAEVALRQCLDVNPEQRDVAEQYGAVRLAQCKWPIVEEGAKPTRRDVVGRLHPLSMCAYSDDPMLQLAAAERYVRAVAPIEERHERFDRRSATAAPGGRRLRIGYVSSDLRHHAVGHLAVQVFEEHDASAFEVFAYYSGIPASDPINARVRTAVEHWRDIRGINDDDAAALIAADEVDILIDVNGHTRDARLGVFARRPAPIQVNWLGYPGTMGSPFHHYIVGDERTIPKDAERYYSERVLRMPCYQPNDRKRIVSDEPQTRAGHGLPDDAFVFCCFNASHKVTRFVFERWLDVLRQTPDSVLWLLDFGPETNAALKAYADARGVAADRLTFAPKMQNALHLARYKLADLFLDTTPYGAHTTASDALWMGVPVLTHPGRCFAARVCASLIEAAGMPELICATPEAFVAEAVRLATVDRARLKALSARLLELRHDSVLFDSAAYTDRLEDLYRTMAREYAAGEMPEPRLASLEAYFEIGVSLDHELREMGALSDYDGFYRQALAARHRRHPMEPDGRLWAGPPTESARPAVAIDQARRARRA